PAGRARRGRPPGLRQHARLRPLDAQDDRLEGPPVGPAQLRRRQPQPLQGRHDAPQDGPGRGLDDGDRRHREVRQPVAQDVGEDRGPRDQLHVHAGPALRLQAARLPLEDRPPVPVRLRPHGGRRTVRRIAPGARRRAAQGVRRLQEAGPQVQEV
ncbi:MAG: hypothetical protein AVDCRST_MAG07-2896, partial [uncultured Frankineae bacterium]